MNILSCFDGLSCGQIALNRLGIKFENYYASEIEPSAIKLTQHNFPKTIQLGDVRFIDLPSLPTIHTLLGGSPCSGFSIAGNGLNFEDERSKLLFDFIRIRDAPKPQTWLLENVATMSKDIKLAIDKAVGVTGIYIDSNLFSPQNRKRLFWSNLNIDVPIFASHLVISDILEHDVSDKYLLSPEKIAKQKIARTFTDGVYTINPVRPDGTQTYQQDRIYDHRGKFPALTATLGNRFNIRDRDGRYRRLTIREQARLQTIPDSYDFSVVSELQASHAIGNGWTIDVICRALDALKNKTHTACILKDQ